VVEDYRSLPEPATMAERIFGTEQVEFVHDGMTIVYEFQKSPDAYNEYTYVCKQRGGLRSTNAAKPKRIFSTGDDSFFNRSRALEAMLILYKAKEGGHQPLIGFLPGLLRMLANLFESTACMDEVMKESVHVADYLDSPEEKAGFERFLSPFVSWVKLCYRFLIYL